MDIQDKPKRRGRPRKTPETPTKPKRPRGRPRKKPVVEKKQGKQGTELSHDQVMVLLKNHLKDVTGIRINWNDVSKIHPNKYIYQIVVDKLSMKFLRKLESIPLVEDVYFFSNNLRNSGDIRD